MHDSKSARRHRHSDFFVLSAEQCWLDLMFSNLLDVVKSAKQESWNCEASETETPWNPKQKIRGTLSMEDLGSMIKKLPQYTKVYQVLPLQRHKNTWPVDHRTEQDICPTDSKGCLNTAFCNGLRYIGPNNDANCAPNRVHFRCLISYQTFC